MGEKIKAFFKNNIGYLVATLVTFAYIFLSILYVDKTEKTLDEIIGTGFVFYLFQMAVSTIFRHQGIINGENDERVLDTHERHGDKVDEIADDMDALESWCERENEKNYKRMRRRILASAGLKYDDYFKKDGVIEPYNVDTAKMSLKWKNRFIREAEVQKIRAYKKAVHLKLSKIDSTFLTSGNPAKEDKFAFGKGKKAFLKSRGIRDAVVRSLPAILFGLYGFRRIEDWTLANLAWTVFQAVIAYSSAIPQMFRAQSYIIDEYRGDVVKKIRLIEQFQCDFNRSPEDFKRTKEELEIRERANGSQNVEMAEGNIAEEIQNGESSSETEETDGNG